MVSFSCLASAHVHPSPLHSGFKGTSLAWLTASSQAKTHNLLSSAFHSPSSHGSKRASIRIRLQLAQCIVPEALFLCAYTTQPTDKQRRMGHEWVNIKCIKIKNIQRSFLLRSPWWLVWLCSAVQQREKWKTAWRLHEAPTVWLNWIMRLHLR